MKPDCFYRFQKVPEKKTLYLLEAFKNEYPALHAISKRKDQVYCYLTAGTSYIDSRRERKPAFTLCSNEQGYISGIYLPDMEEAAHLGYGDIKGTEDGLICKFSENYLVLEIYAIKGQKSTIDKRSRIMVDGELEQEPEGIRIEAIEALEGTPEQTMHQTES